METANISDNNQPNDGIMEHVQEHACTHTTLTSIAMTLAFKYELNTAQQTGVWIQRDEQE